MNDPKNTPPTGDESGLPTTPNAQSRAAYFEDMLPGVIASDERDGRVVQAQKRRRNNVPLSIDEVRRDLRGILTQLTTSYMQYEQGFSTFLRTPTHALDYAERVAAYAIKDYPRDFEGDEHIAGQWDALNSIHVIGYAWRKGEDKTDSKILVATVEQIAANALMGVYAKHQADETDKVARVTEEDASHDLSQALPLDNPSNNVETARMEKIPKQVILEHASILQVDTDVGNTAGQTNIDLNQLDTDVGNTAAQTNIAIELPGEGEAVKTEVVEETGDTDADKSDSPEEQSSTVNPSATDDKIDFSW